MIKIIIKIKIAINNLLFKIMNLRCITEIEENFLGIVDAVVVR